MARKRLVEIDPQRLAEFQAGIRNEEAAERLAREGIDVVQDACLLVELRSIGR